MSYFKSREQANAEAMGSLIGGVFGMAIKFIVFCFVYSPFVFIFSAVFYVAYERYGLHWIVSGILGLVGVLLLLGVIMFLYVAERELRKEKNLFWIFFSTINVLIIAGMPFFIGMLFGVNLVGLETASMFEKILAGGFGGCLLAIPAYVNVVKALQTYDRQYMDASNTNA